MRPHLESCNPWLLPPRTSPPAHQVLALCHNWSILEVYSWYSWYSEWLLHAITIYYYDGFSHRYVKSQIIRGIRRLSLARSQPQLGWALPASATSIGKPASLVNFALRPGEPRNRETGPRLSPPFYHLVSSLYTTEIPKQIHVDLGWPWSIFLKNHEIMVSWFYSTFWSIYTI